MCAKSCPTPCNPMDYSPPGSSVLGILQTKILEQVSIPAPGNRVVWSELDWSGYWSGLPLLPPGDLPDPEIEPVSPKLLRYWQTLYC